MRKFPKIHLLESFCEIMRFGTVTEAAKNLNLTQSAVSRQLAQLETELGITLFLRDKGRLLPLPEAQELCREVEFTLSGFERICHLAEDLQSLSVAKLHIASTQGFIDGVLIGAITSFMERYPNVKISIDSRNSDEIVEQVICRAVDCGFIKSPLFSPQLSIDPMITCGTVCAMNMDNPLAKLSRITAKDLHNIPIILLRKGENFKREIQHMFQQAGAFMDVKAETYTASASCALAAKGIGIAPVHEIMARSYRHMGIALIPLEPVIKHEFSFVTPSQVPMSRAVQVFHAHCKARFKSMETIV